MFKCPSLGSIETMAGLVNDRVQLRQTNGMTALSRAIYFELSAVEPDTLENLLKFYQEDKQHEDLMEDTSIQVAHAINGFLIKVQNEVLDIADTCFETVSRSTEYRDADVITHKIDLIPEIDFFDCDSVEAVLSFAKDVRTRVDVPKNSAHGFNPRTRIELLDRISKSMPKGDYAKFQSMVDNLGVDVVAIYDKVIRGYESDIRPYAEYGTLALPYTHLESVTAYHIAKSLMDTQDEETRLTEVAYFNYVSAIASNMAIRYEDSVGVLRRIMVEPTRKATYSVQNDVITLKAYAPIIEKFKETEETSQQDAIETMLGMIIEAKFGKLSTRTPQERYQIFRRDATARYRLQLSQKMVLEVIKYFESWIATPAFITWYETNYDDKPSERSNLELLDKIRKRTTYESVGSPDELYSLIINIVSNDLYQNPGVSKFINHMRMLMVNNDMPVHEAMAAATDKAIVDFYLDMVEVV